MVWPEKESIESLIYKLAILAAGSVLVLSIYNGYHFLLIILRTIAAFLIIYFLGKGLMAVWDSLSPPPAEPTFSKIDVLLGDQILNDENGNLDVAEDEGTFSPGSYQGTLPGQINANLKNKLSDAEQKAQIAQKMGWGK
jgi:hypothetical protein